MSEDVTFDDVLNDVARYLRHEREEGTTRIEASRDNVAALAEAAVCPAGGADRTTENHGDRAKALADIAARAAACRNCPLHAQRTKPVPGQGSTCPEIMFVGEAPGRDEDREGVAFIGAAGKLLTKMIEAMGYKREDVFIGNILKCRPPGNRTPMPDEMAMCMPFLKEQIAILKPRVIVALGGTAAKGLLDTTVGITKLRGQWMLFEGIDTMPTYHPAYLLRNPSGKRPVWEDLQEVLRRVGRTPPPRKR